MAARYYNFPKIEKKRQGIYIGNYKKKVAIINYKKKIKLYKITQICTTIKLN